MGRASRVDDELLMYELGRALESTRSVPPEDRVMELRAMVCVRYPDGDAIDGRGVAPARVPRFRAAIVSTALGLSMAGGGAAFAAGASLPGPIRAAAARIGLPVVPPAVAAARSAEVDLRNQLQQVASRPESNHTEAVTNAAVVLVTRVVRLSPAERQSLGAAPAELLTLAHTYTPLAPVPPMVLAPRPSTIPVVTGPQVLATAPAVADHPASAPLAEMTPDRHVYSRIYVSPPIMTAPVASQPLTLARPTGVLPTTVSRSGSRTTLPHTISGSTTPSRPTRPSGGASPAMMLSADR